MTSLTRFDTGHEDLIHGVAYDYYGKRLVTCSSDQRLKVWDFTETQDAALWELNDAWKGHDASIMKAVWAPAEYGQIIASCSFDKSVKIWEEQPVEPKGSQRRWAERYRLVESKGAVLDIAFSPAQGALRLATCSADGVIRIYEAMEPTNLSQWSQMEEFNMDKDGAPVSMASPNVNQMVPTSSLLSQQQQLQQQQQEYQQQLLQQIHQQQQGANAQTTASKQPQLPSQPSWPRPTASSDPQDSTPANVTSMATPASAYLSGFHGQDGQGGGSVTTTMDEAAQQARLHLGNLNNSSSSSNLASVAAANAAARTPGSSSSGSSSYTDTTPGMILPNGTFNMTSLDPSSASVEALYQQHHQLQQQHLQQTSPLPQPMDTECAYCLDWCPNRTSTPMMVVGTGKIYGAKIFKHDGNNRWYPGEELLGHTDQVNDVSWAPSMGRSYQLIATACRDHYVRIYRLTDITAPVRTPGMVPKQKAGRSFKMTLVAAFKQHEAEVWRVEWNITGTILSSSGADRTVRLWRAGFDGEWRQIAVIHTDQKQS
ncbi:WD40 repeat-like protein [Hesseltinella vesiculosa]|uniref:WD40 repeat-like protein n=1 Tax=Hesseltinella vesiculosa TaxID=101127 RepID=A0A1X2GUX2_9FUNG|nr:WD40 repeat-like protein [Hesseltinella vesiculosa]